MCKVTLVVIASVLMASSWVAFSAGKIPSHELCQADNSITATSQRHHMFDGINLTALQRQQMRDLMRYIRQQFSQNSISHLKTIHHLVTAPLFNEHAARVEIGKRVQMQIQRQVEMLRVRNKMYNLLTAVQKKILDQKYQLRLEHMLQRNMKQ